MTIQGAEDIDQTKQHGNLDRFVVYISTADEQPVAEVRQFGQ